jgi:hypothetical protein
MICNDQRRSLPQHGASSSPYFPCRNSDKEKSLAVSLPQLPEMAFFLTDPGRHSIVVRVVCRLSNAQKKAHFPAVERCFTRKVMTMKSDRLPIRKINGSDNSFQRMSGNSRITRFASIPHDRDTSVLSNGFPPQRRPAVSTRVPCGFLMHRLHIADHDRDGH